MLLVWEESPVVGGKLIVRNKTVHKVFATKIVSIVVRRRVAFSKTVNISTKTIFNYGCGSDRPKHIVHCGTTCYGGPRCTKLHAFLGAKSVFKRRFYCRSVPRRLSPFSCRTCHGGPVSFCIIIASTGAKGTLCGGISQYSGARVR